MLYDWALLVQVVLSWLANRLAGRPVLCDLNIVYAEAAGYKHVGMSQW